MGAILMQSSRNRQNQLWLLAGTGEGPRIAAALINLGWRVQVSVVTPSAARAYASLGVESIAVGALQGQATSAFLAEQGPFQWVVDATHPFATQISADLEQVCGGLDQRLLRLERPMESGGSAMVLKRIEDLSGFSLQGRRLMLAIGTSDRGKWFAWICGAEVFARPCLRPLGYGVRWQRICPGTSGCVETASGKTGGSIEQALCRQWMIADVLCRQSGGVTERLWRRIALSRGCSCGCCVGRTAARWRLDNESDLLERIAHG